ncbi:MAG: TlpA family protein disulfide reductase [Gammaproteobacteria bacterium]|nr:TlpA family protein disulfide reductase [Gammaproteobacteria bacterium]
MSSMRIISTLLLLLFLCHNSLAAEQGSISLSSGNDINYSRYAAEGSDLILWFYSEAGPQSHDILLAQAIAKAGTEIWLIDLFASYFLPVALSSMDNIPAADISELIRLAQAKSGKTIYAVGTGRAAIPLLRGTQQLQRLDSADQSLGGLILISPKFYVSTPEPGQQGKLMPVVSNSNALIFVIQPKESPWFWKLDHTLPALQQGGSDVFLQLINDVRDRFYFRPDADAYEDSVSKQLPMMLRQAISGLKNFPKKSRTPGQQSAETFSADNIRKVKKLRPHKANPIPPALALADMNSQQVDLEDYKNSVVLVNFWASWCPPCVHEMPSMQRLQDHFTNDKFIILGVNMAEKKPVIEEFLKTKVSVSFPVLLDTDGAALKRWQVFAFPSSYLIDKKGRIRYSLFGSIEWDNSDTLSVIRQLVNE